jgi:hypothetical protein
MVIKMIIKQQSSNQMSEIAKWLGTLPKLYKNRNQPAIPLPDGAFKHPYLFMKPISKLMSNEVAGLSHNVVINLLNNAGIETDIKTGLFEFFKHPDNIDDFGDTLKENGELNLVQYVEYLARIIVGEYIPIKSVDSRNSISLLIGHTYTSVLSGEPLNEYAEYENGAIKCIQHFHIGNVYFYYDRINEFRYQTDCLKIKTYPEVNGIDSYEIIYELIATPENTNQDTPKVAYVKYSINYFNPNGPGELISNFVSAQVFNEILKRIKQEKMIKAKTAVNQITWGLIKLELVESIIADYL